ncbi:MAG: hypothetical protein ABFS12_04710 [Bacteroidota bacterium]
MIKKSYYIVTFLAVLLIIGCENEPVAPTNSSPNKIFGETNFVEYESPGTVTQFEDGTKQIRKQIAIFNDSSNDMQLSGLRKIELNHNFDSNNEGSCYGTFSLETKNGYWEGDWTGETTSTGTTIKAIGYNLDDREQYCKWEYYFPSSDEGKSGTYSAKIFFDDRN